MERQLYRKFRYQQYEKVYARKRAELASKKEAILSKVADFRLSERVESKLLSLDATGIKQMLDQNEVTSEELVRFYTKRTLTVGEKFNIAVDFMFDSAIARAREIDLARTQLSPEERARQPSLYGIPISIKDTFAIKGTDATLGQGINCFKPAEKTGLAVRNLEEHGLIPFIKTNVPQSLLVNETNNYIFGRTRNPYNLERTSGGSLDAK